MAIRRVADVDWASWTPTDLATLTFVIREGRMLLIRKKRGLGAGKISAPGGRLERCESWRDCAVREVEEELCITPLDPIQVGWNRFQFVDGYAIHVGIFRASSFRGTPTETAEADPLWADLDALPYEEMWADDPLWVPLVVAGRPFSGHFVFDGEVMLDHAIEMLAANPH